MPFRRGAPLDGLQPSEDSMRLIILAALAVALVTTGCMAQRPVTQAYHVDANGSVSTATRSALNGSTAPGPQEIIGVYIPFIGTGLAIKAGLEWDGITGPIVIPVPTGPSAASYGAPCAAPQAAPPCYTPQVQPQRTVTLPVPRAAAPIKWCP
jgi:hypothetical protein